MGDNVELFWKRAYADSVDDELSPVEKQLRDMFVHEYLFDRDRVAAAIRCGFNVNYAKVYADQFWCEPYTQQRLKQALLEDEDEAAQEAMDRKAVLMTLREALNVGPYASRVQAAARLAQILGMDKGKSLDEEDAVLGGVMTVPGIASVDEWESMAADSQAKLVQETRA